MFGALNRMIRRHEAAPVRTGAPTSSTRPPAKGQPTRAQDERQVQHKTPVPSGVASSSSAKQEGKQTSSEASTTKSVDARQRRSAPVRTGAQSSSSKIATKESIAARATSSQQHQPAPVS